jgi:hypothetical protein
MKTDVKEAEKHYRKACNKPEEPDPEACSELASLLDEQKREPGEAARARADRWGSGSRSSSASPRRTAGACGRATVTSRARAWG